MKNKTFRIIACLAIAVALPAFAENQKPIDLVVVMDASSSMHGSFRSVTEYAIGPMLKDFLRIGDTFPLLSFSDRPRMELSRRIEGIGDVETIIGRMMLLYPIVPYSDVISALEYLSVYLKELPETRLKTVLFISDGEHLPPASSPYAGIGSEQALDRLGAAASALKGNGWTFYFVRTPFQGETRPVPLVPRPLTGTARNVPALAGSSPAGSSPAGSSPAGTAPVGPPQAGTSSAGTAQSSNAPAGTSETERPETTSEKTGAAGAAPAGSPDANAGTGAVDVSDAVAGMLAAPLVDIGTEGADAVGTALGSLGAEFPADLGTSSRRVVVPLTIRNPSSDTVYVEASSLLVDGVDRIAKKAFVEIPPRGSRTLKIKAILPDDFAAGPSVLRIEPVFSGDIRINPAAADVRVSIQDAPMRAVFALIAPWAILGIGIGIALALAFFIILFIRGMHAGPGRAAAGAAERQKPAPSPARLPSPTRPNPETVRPIPAKRSSVPTVAIQGSSVPTVARNENPRGDADLLASFAARTKGDGGPMLPAGSLASAGKKDVAQQQAALQQAAPQQLVAPQKQAALQQAALQQAASRTIAQRTASHAREDLAVGGERPIVVRKANARIMLSLYVEDQSTLIGRRNVHLLKAGSSLSVGGDRSDFLIFLVRFPRRIAEIRFDGEKCMLVPRLRSYFPDSGDEAIEDCVGKTIRVVSRKGFELRIRFDRYEDPLDNLNRFLHSIELPGR